MSGLRPSADFWSGKRVLVTGHTGFKGGWLCQWLALLGAEVHGLALPPETDPSFFELTGVRDRLTRHSLQNICDFGPLQEVIAHAEPEIVFHMAAQALVLRSYDDPLECFETNVMGTANVLQAIRSLQKNCVVINVTSDKCYENSGSGRPFTETDAMGGSDPYSASKGCAELVARSFQRSFFASEGIGLASVRAGNVIGGGDWAKNRLVPDAVRALQGGGELEVRHPDATRPWQHVLEPLSGYLTLAERLAQAGEEYCGGWNFGPRPENAVSVRTLLAEISRITGQSGWRLQPGKPLQEAQRLHLDIDKARSVLGWEPALDLGQTVQMTMDWYLAAQAGSDMGAVTETQISDYTALREGMTT